MKMCDVWQGVIKFVKTRPIVDTAARWQTTSTGWLMTYSTICGIISLVLGAVLKEYGLPVIWALGDASFSEIMRPIVIAGSICLYFLTEWFLFFALQCAGAQAVIRKRQFGD